jgi:MerR family copper efflux transcriptional regulator
MTMNIGQVSQMSGLPTKTIRYYEEIGLVSPARASNGYRAYGEREVHNLVFLQRARKLGFSIEECRHLLSLYQDTNRASADVKRLARARIDEIDARIAELKSLRSTLGHLADACHGDERPECPILDDLAGKILVD